MKPKILVIKHGALGDFILATGPMKAIRAFHLDAEITLLTTKPYAEMAKKSGFFDIILLDSRPKLYHFKQLRTLICALRSPHFNRVYDLQTSKRSNFYYHIFFGQKIEWSGIASGASHRHSDPNRIHMHTLDRHRAQLALAGITNVPAPDISWLKSDISRFNLPKKYALLITGCSYHRPGKRWSEEGFINVAKYIEAKKITPLLIGTEAEKERINYIAAHCHSAINFCGKTTIEDIAELGRHAEFAIGNDTGPTHIVAAAGCKTLALFSAESNPKLAKPPGDVTVIQVENLAHLPAEKVIEWVQLIFG